jgi:hypothetical protein
LEQHVGPDDVIREVPWADLRLDVFCGLLRTLGRALRKEVRVYSDGADDYPPMMAYDPVIDGSASSPADQLPGRV